MSDIPSNEVTEQDLHLWYELNQQLSKLKSQEALLRQKIFNGKFLSPREGTNSVALADGWVLKGNYVINRTVDNALLQNLRDKFAEEGIFTDQIVEYKPSLKIGEYRKLTAEEQRVFDQCLIVKPGMPALEIVLPKRRTQA